MSRDVKIFEITRVANGFLVNPRQGYDSAVPYENQFVFLTLKELADHLAAQWGIPSIDHRLFKTTSERLEFVPMTEARESIYKTMPAPVGECKAPDGKCCAWNTCLGNARCCYGETA